MQACGGHPDRKDRNYRAAFPVVSCLSRLSTDAAFRAPAGIHAPSWAPIPICMFDQLRDAMRGFSERSGPDERRRAAYAMKEALVHAKMGVQDLRSGVTVTERRVAQERDELATVERRLGLAAQINDQETVAIAERFRAQHAERLAVLETKLMSQQQELNLMERELEEMTVQLRRAMSGLPISPDAAIEREAMEEVNSAIGDTRDTAGSQSSVLDDELKSPRLTRAEKEANAADRLAELKRRMGK